MQIDTALRDGPAEPAARLPAFHRLGAEPIGVSAGGILTELEALNAEPLAEPHGDRQTEERRS